jgi:hypothetical protein
VLAKIWEGALIEVGILPIDAIKDLGRRFN